MGNLTQYDFSGTKPEFSKPSCSKQFPYSKSTGSVPKEVSESKQIATDSIRQLESLNERVEKLKQKIESLKNTWNKCIVLEGSYKEYVVEEDMTRTTKMISDAYDNKESIKSIIDSSEEKINEIKNYREQLNNNRINYDNLVKALNNAESYINSAKDDSTKAYWRSQYNATNKKLSEYQDVGDIQDYGKWV